MATVVVTGGAGKLGRACVKDLAEHGWQVVVFDRARTDTGVIQVPVDLTDYGQVIDAMLGVEERYERVDAVVHLAAVPAPGIVGDHATFTNNMNATWNVVQRGPAGRHHQDRLGLQRDRAGAAVRHPAAVRARSTRTTRRDRSRRTRW